MKTISLTLAVVLVIMLTDCFLPRARAEMFSGSCQMFDDNGASAGKANVNFIVNGTEMNFNYSVMTYPPNAGFITKSLGPTGFSHTGDPARGEVGMCTDTVRSTTDGTYWFDQRCDAPGASSSWHAVMHRTDAHTYTIDVQGDKHYHGTCTDVTPPLNFNFYSK
jgi:hypothetical protein